MLPSFTGQKMEDWENKSLHLDFLSLAITHVNNYGCHLTQLQDPDKQR
jgi:hypothetical protein